ncbi:hypothetical protein [uncultured Gilvimarinus sp.]|uniref:hypothetical protein n=1 Tax=uncultured Gilvimarinus sp. TaxID=1689143 RepID=UPI0030EF143F|tara:strand:+ start:1068 stop:1430 length:363 start_codon:yes stop_codon:yes gene_type:complete
MPRLFDVLLCGTQIYFDNGTEQSIIGFLSARRVANDSLEDAVLRARHDVLIDWNHTYNADRKLGVPKLTTVQVQAANKWLHRNPTEDFYFFDSEQRKQEHLALILDSARPWWRLRKRRPG